MQHFSVYALKHKSIFGISKMWGMQFMIFLTLLLICIFKPLPIFRSPLFLNLCQTNIVGIIANGKEKC